MKRGEAMPIRRGPLQAKERGFTIVELLIVVVVIAILAAITIVAYNGIQQRAIQSSVQSDLTTASTQIKLHYATVGSYPVSASVFNNGQGLKTSAENTITYTNTGGGYCVGISTARAGGISFHQSSADETIQTGNCATPPPVALVNASSFRNNGTSGLTIALPAAISDGDLLFVAIQVGGPDRDITDWSAKGWWQLNDTLLGSREIFIFARAFNSNDASSVYSLTLDGSTQIAGVSAALRGHSVASASDLIIGSTWIRASNGGSQNLTVAPAVTTTRTGTYVLAFFGGATSTSTVKTPSGSFTLLAERNKDPSPEWPGVFGRSMTTAGSTGAQTWTENASSATVNGFGLQIAVP